MWFLVLLPILMFWAAGYALLFVARMLVEFVVLVLDWMGKL